MGLFYEGAAQTQHTSKPAAKLKLTDIEKRHLTCSDCSLNRERMQHPKMLPTGAGAPLLYFLGDSPDAADDATGRQFVGSSGQFLFARLPVDVDEYSRRNNVLRCRPLAGNEPVPLEIECCRKLQVADIEQAKPQVIVALGPVALKWLLGSGKVMHIWRGRRAPVRVGTHTCWAYFIEHPEHLLRKQGDRKYGEALVRAFERDIQRIFNDINAGLPEPFVEPASDYKKGIEYLPGYGTDGMQWLERVLGQLAGIEHAHDIETNMLRPYSPEAKILSVAIGTYGSTYAYGWEHAEARWSAVEHRRIAEMHEAYLMGPGLKWAHEAKFEQEWWHSRFGPKIVFDTKWADTLGQAHILDERGSTDDDKSKPGGKAKGLGELTMHHFGFDVKAQSPIDRKKLATTPLHYVLPYNGLDTKYTHALSVVQGDLLAGVQLTHVYERLNSYTAALVTMQAKGVVRNVPVIDRLDREMEGRVQITTAKILGHKDVLAFKASGRKFEPTSNPDLIIFFRDYLKLKSTGRVTSDDKGVEKYAVDDDSLTNMPHPVARWVLEMRGESNRRKFVTPLKDGGKYVHADGLVHSSYSQYIAASGRLTSREPNEQNYPRRGPEAKVVRQVIKAPDEKDTAWQRELARYARYFARTKGKHKFVAFDYGQLEWRIGAALSRDKRMREELAAEQDIHGHWTDSLGSAFGPQMLRDDRKGLRDSLKNDWTFSNLYGNSPGAIAYALSRIFSTQIDERLLSPHYNEFWNTYPELKAYQDEVMRIYWEQGYVETGTGQRRREPLARNEAINHPFQGTAGHLVIDAQSRISRFAYEHDRPSLQPIMNIHDDLSFYFPLTTIEQDVEDVARMMLIGIFEFVDVPMLVECSVGDNWAEKKEIGAFKTKDFV